MNVVTQLLLKIALCSKTKKHVKFLVTTVDTNVQLGTLLHRISKHKPLKEWISDETKRMLNENVFGDMLRADDTPYGDNLSVAKLNQYRKDPNNGPMLTAETLVDLKPFALKLGSFLYNIIISDFDYLLVIVEDKISFMTVMTI